MAIRVGVIGATGNTGTMVVEGLLSSSTDFFITSFTREGSVHNQANQKLKEKGVKIAGYDLDGARARLVEQLKEIDVLISCITWEHLHLQLPWIVAAKVAGIKCFIPSEWVGPAPRGVIDIKDKYSRRFNVRVFRTPSSTWGAIIKFGFPGFPPGDGSVKFALTDLSDIGKYVAQIIADPRTLNKHVLAYTEVLSMNEIWDVMAKASGEEPPKDYVTEAELHEIIASCRARLKPSPEDKAHHPRNIMDTANFNMGQYRISWCVRGDNTPEYADYLGYLNFWKLFPEFPKGKSLEQFYREVLDGAPLDTATVPESKEN